ILVDLDTTVEGVAAVVGIYTAVLTMGLLPAAALERRMSARFAGAAGLAVFAFAGAMCGTVDDLRTLLIWRALQAAGAALALVAAFALLGPGPAWRRAHPALRLARDLPLPGARRGARRRRVPGGGSGKPDRRRRGGDVAGT